MAIDLNNYPLQEDVVVVYHDVDAISGALAKCADRWVPEVFPQGRIVAGELRLANIQGRAPRKQGSCVIQLSGDHSGSWFDHEFRKGGGPLSTLREGLGLHGEELLRVAVELIERHGASSYLVSGSTAHGPAARPQVDRHAAEVQINLAKMVPLAGTLGETYLRARGLTRMPDTEDLGFYSGCTHWATKTAKPALIARFRDPEGKPAGSIHRIYLLDDGSWHTGEKLMLGSVDGAVIMLQKINQIDGYLGVGEGIESTLAALELFGGGVGAWACASDGGMRKFAAWLRLNAGVLPIKKLLVWGDAKRAGASAAGELFATAREQGLPAELYMPRSGDDFAEDLKQGLLPEARPNGFDAGPTPFGWRGPQAEPEILPPGAASAEAVIEMAGRLSKQYTVVEISSIVTLLGQGGFSALVEEKVFSLIRQRTGLSVATIKRELRKTKPGSKGGSGDAPTWAAEIIRTVEGEPVPIEKNVLIALQGDPAWQGIVGLDDFHQLAMLMRRPPWDVDGITYPRPFTDVDEVRVMVWMQEQGIHVRAITIVRNALGIVAEENRYHPVRDYLESLKWDGVGRIDKWLTYYLGVEPIDNYTSPVGACWLISAVARIFQPGCIAKYVLILEGDQDLKKSTALETLGTPWFTDDMSELGTKDSAMQIGNAWIVELSELDSVRKAHLSAIKSFISRKVDRFRKPYGRNIIEQPRQCVLAGTINPSSPYILDETGGVRFWPVLCKAIDIETLKNDRDQLWAEAVVRYNSGARWYLDDDNKVQAAYKQQELRLSVDSWESNIRKFFKDYPTITELTVSDILERVFAMPKKDHDRPSQTRVGIIMKRIGQEIGWRVDIASNQRPRPYVRRK